MDTPTVIARPRIERPDTQPVGKSGTRTLEVPSLVQDKSRREELKKADIARFLAAGGLQDPTTEITPAVEMEQEIKELFSAPDWNSFSQL